MNSVKRQKHQLKRKVLWGRSDDTFFFLNKYDNELLSITAVTKCFTCTYQNRDTLR